MLNVFYINIYILLEFIYLKELNLAYSQTIMEKEIETMNFSLINEQIIKQTIKNKKGLEKKFKWSKVLITHCTNT